MRRVFALGTSGQAMNACSKFTMTSAAMKRSAFGSASINHSQQAIKSQRFIQSLARPAALSFASQFAAKQISPLSMPQQSMHSLAKQLQSKQPKKTSFAFSPLSQPLVRHSSTSSPNDALPNDVTGKALAWTASMLSHLQTAKTVEIYHYSNITLAVLTPFALVLSPTFLNIPVDFALGLVIPVHSHIGCSGIIEDYVPRAQQQLVKAALFAITAITIIGLLKVNLCGAGITESVKSLWRAPPTAVKQSHIEVRTVATQSQPALAVVEKTETKTVRK